MLLGKYLERASFAFFYVIHNELSAPALPCILIYKSKPDLFLVSSLVGLCKKLSTEEMEAHVCLKPPGCLAFFCLASTRDAVKVWETTPGNFSPFNLIIISSTWVGIKKNTNEEELYQFCI